MRKTIEHITFSPFQPERWALALENMAAAGGGWAAQLIAADDRGDIPFHWSCGLSQDAVEEFERRGGASGAVNPRAMAAYSMPVLQTRIDNDFIDDAGMRRSIFYNEVIQRFDADFICMSRLHSLGTTRPILAIIRSKRQQRFELRDRQTVETLAPYFSSALRCHSMLEGRDIATIAKTLDILDWPALLLDAQQRLCGSTRAGQDMLSEESLLRSRGGRIKAIDMKSDARLQSSLGRICGGRASQMPDFASIVCLGREGTPHHVEIASLPKGPWFVGTGAVAILSLRLDRKRAGREQLLRDAYGLTKTESEIAILLSSGGFPR